MEMIGAKSLTSRAILCASFGEAMLCSSRHVFVDFDDNILVACSKAIQVFKSDGTHLKTIGKGLIAKASGVLVDLTGRIFVSDRDLNKIVCFD